MKILTLYQQVTLAATVAFFCYTGNAQISSIHKSNPVHEKIIAGMCYDAQTHIPLADVEIMITGAGDVFNLQTDAHGYFKMRDKALKNNTTYRIKVQYAGYIPDVRIIEITTPDCTVNGCGYEVIQDVECHYYDNPN